MGLEAINLPPAGAGADARIQLANGEMFAPLDPDPEMLTLEAIACGLANTCRFGGQVKPFYAVSQHSVLVAYLAGKSMPEQKYAILHDGEEAFGLPDLATPLKPFFPGFVHAQARIAQLIFDRHGVDPAMKPRVKPLDTLALSIEKRDLKHAIPGYLADLPPAPGDIHVNPLTPRAAERQFLAACRRIFREGRPIDRDWLAGQPGFSLETRIA